MKVIIPMSGMGKRFIAAGYTTPKPLIEIDGMPIIEHVVNMFPGEKDFIFICNSFHLANTNMKAVLQRIAPKAQIIEIPPHKKGPVYAVHLAENLIEDDEEVIVNYCDFACYWDYRDFLDHTRGRNADGAVPAYKGFHPHMLGDTNYAFMRSEKQWMLEIKEKEPFTDNRMQEYASIGTYYFKKGSYVKKYFKELMAREISIKDEFYVSLVYNLLVEDQLSVSVYEVQHMLQWGTPQDVSEYLVFSNYFRDLLTWKRQSGILGENSITNIPLAGRGSRFEQKGFKVPKPLITVAGKPMIVQAANYLPEGKKSIFVCLKEHLMEYPLEEEIKLAYPNAVIYGIDGVTEGQACTVALGLEDQDFNASLLIGACDNGMIYNQEEFKNLITENDVDAVVWTFKNHPSSIKKPEMYGWIKVDNDGIIEGVSVKKPISDNPGNDHAIVGTFYFRNTEIFLQALEFLKENDQRINGEFYVDSCIDALLQLGYKAKVFQVDHYLGWGTPDDYLTYKYWQSFFHKVTWHPYRLHNDPTVNHKAISELEKEYTAFKQQWN